LNEKTNEPGVTEEASSPLLHEPELQLITEGLEIVSVWKLTCGENKVDRHGDNKHGDKAVTVAEGNKMPPLKEHMQESQTV